MPNEGGCDISELMLGIECGGSDATSGIASNPAVGELSDLLVDLGATTMMSESIEWIGGEHLLAKRAATPAIPDIRSVDRDLTTCDIIESWHKLHQGRFTATGTSYNRCRLARSCFKIKICQNIFIRSRICEAYMFVTDNTLYSF